MSQCWTTTLMVGVMLGVTSSAQASLRLNRSDCADDCQGVLAAPATQMVEKTIFVPQWSTESRTITVTECRPETRSREITTTRCEPYTEQITRVHRVNDLQQRSRTFSYTARKPVYETVTKEYSVCVPHQVERQGVRTVCRMVPTTVERVVREDHGHWEGREVAGADASVNACNGGCNDCCGGRRGLFGRRHSCCGDCASSSNCGAGMAKFWVPNIVEKTVTATVMRPKFSQEQYSYTAIEMRRETGTRQVQVCRMVAEQRTREVTELICVPRNVTKTFNVTRYRQVPETKTVQYRVMVPQQVEKEVQALVCHMVAKTVMVPAACSGGDSSDCDGGRGLLGRRCSR